MPTSDLEETVHALLRARSPLASGDLPDDLPLGAGGLGLGSIALAELLLDCEERFGLTLVEEMLEGPPLTVGEVVSRIRAATLR